LSEYRARRQRHAGSGFTRGVFSIQQIFLNCRCFNNAWRRHADCLTTRNIRVDCAVDALHDNQANAGIAEIARAIERYLATHPNAADSVEGIRRWWLMRQRYEESAQQVQQALEQLLGQGVITKRVLTDGQVLYARQSKISDDNSIEP
jgi:hypothetical protein